MLSDRVVFESKRRNHITIMYLPPGPQWIKYGLTCRTQWAPDGACTPRFIGLVVTFHKDLILKLSFQCAFSIRTGARSGGADVT